MKRQIRLLAQADLLLLMADLFRPPEKIRRPLDSLKKPNLKMLVEATGLEGMTDLMHQLHTTIKSARRADRDEWAGCYRLLFDSSMVCPVNEAGYIRRDKGAILSDICGFYHAFGWTAATNSGERPDHLLVELEFTAMLLVMSARAKTRDQAELTEEALAEFTRQHLSDWLFAFCEQLKLSTSYPIYLGASDLLSRIWNALVQWHDWTIDPAPASTAGMACEPENPYECGAPDLVNLGTDTTH